MYIQVEASAGLDSGRAGSWTEAPPGQCAAINKDRGLMQLCHGVFRKWARECKLWMVAPAA